MWQLKAPSYLGARLALTEQREVRASPVPRDEGRGGLAALWEKGPEEPGGVALAGPIKGRTGDNRAPGLCVHKRPAIEEHFHSDGAELSLGISSSL